MAHSIWADHKNERIADHFDLVNIAIGTNQSLARLLEEGSK
jgi:hypothetical protein